MTPRLFLCSVANFMESKLGLALGAAALTASLLGVGYQGWRDWPRGKPSTVLETNLTTEWRGNNLWLTLHFRVQRVRDDCTYQGDRFVDDKNDPTNPHRYILEGARTITVPVGDTSWHEISVVGVDALEPGKTYTFGSRGVFRCPENMNYPSDPISIEFTAPPKPSQRSDR